MDELQRQLRAFSQAYGQKGKAIVERIQQLMDGGMTVTQAVQQAFQEYDVADWLDANVSQAIVSTAQDALGAELAGALSSAELLKALSTPWDGSGMTLSQKLHGASREMRQSIVETVQNQIRRNSTIQKAAQALYDGYGYGHVTGTQELPRYLDELTRWVRSSRESMTPVDQLSMLKAIRKAKAQADGLVDDRVTYNHFRTSLKELLAKVESGSDKAARKALQVAVEEKADMLLNGSPGRKQPEQDMTLSLPDMMRMTASWPTNGRCRAATLWTTSATCTPKQTSTALAKAFSRRTQPR